MLTSLMLGIALQAQEVEAKVYTGHLRCPVSEKLLDTHNIEKFQKYLRMYDRTVTVTVAGDSVRCDTDDRLSVVKTEEGEYFMIDHAKKEVLIYPPQSTEAGRAAVCSTTPFWPEAFGELTSFEAMESATVVVDGVSHSRFEARPKPANSEEPQKYSFGGNKTPGGIALDYYLFVVVKEAIEGFHNIELWAYIDAKPEPYRWNMYLDLPSGIPGEPSSAKTVSVNRSLFTYPDGYSLRLADSAEGYSGAAKASPDWIKKFVWGFEIPAAFPPVTGRELMAG